ncbi:hypothetical protein FG379_000819 [Cryptosporidium bovis]|uniref:uncharacterized protein n=1 Tax=Cryptosporidium bovis TaxID=310047 RepID=UPI00351A1418|nr:hypothetical protein FG379_000819 [Cryptosporidium bovis]
MKNSLRASVESSSTTISVDDINSETPSHKRKYVKKEANEIEEYKRSNTEQ